MLTLHSYTTPPTMVTPGDLNLPVLLAVVPVSNQLHPREDE
jgi:hypothetical protein